MSRPKSDTVRTNIYLPKLQHDAVSALASRTGTTFADHIRRAVDFYLAFSEDVHDKVEKIAEMGKGGRAAD